MYTIPMSDPNLPDTFKNTVCGDGSHFTAYGRPKRVGCLSKRIDAYNVCTYPKKCLLVDEWNSRTALVHADGLWHGEVKPNCVFQPQSREALEELKKMREGNQQIAGDENTITMAAAQKAQKSQNIQKKIDASLPISKTRSGKVLEKFPREHIENMADSLKEVLAAREAGTTSKASMLKIEDPADFDIVVVDDEDGDWELIDAAKVDKEYMFVPWGATDGAIVRKIL